MWGKFNSLLDDPPPGTVTVYEIDGITYLYAGDATERQRYLLDTTNELLLIDVRFVKHGNA